MQYNCRIILDNHHYWSIRLTLDYGRFCVISIKRKYFNNNVDMDICLSAFSFLRFDVHTMWCDPGHLAKPRFPNHISSTCATILLFKFTLFKLVYDHKLFMLGFITVGTYTVYIFGHLSIYFYTFAIQRPPFGYYAYAKSCCFLKYPNQLQHFSNNVR